MKKLSKEEATEAKRKLSQDLKAGALTLGQATREMRRIVGMNQQDYAKLILGVAPRVLMDIENDRGNPQLDTLEKIAKPFKLKVIFYPDSHLKEL